MLRLVKFNFVWASVANFRTLFLGALVACRSRHATAAKFLEETVETWMELKLVFFFGPLNPNCPEFGFGIPRIDGHFRHLFLEHCGRHSLNGKLLSRRCFFFFSMNVPFDHVHVSLAFVGILARRLGPAGISYWIVI